MISLVHHICTCWTRRANAGLFADTDEELDSQLKNFDNHSRTHNQKLRQKQAELQYEGDAAGDLRQKHQSKHGQATAQVRGKGVSISQIFIHLFLKANHHRDIKTISRGAKH